MSRPIDQKATCIVNYCNKNQYEQKESAGFIIKEQTYQKEVYVPYKQLLIYQAIACKNDKKENPESRYRKKKWSLRIICEYRVNQRLKKVFTAGIFRKSFFNFGTGRYIDSSWRLINR